MKSIFANMFWHLPYDFRRHVYLLANPVKFKHLQDLRASRNMMPVIERNCLFIHIPKAAGISIAKSLFGTPAGFHTSIRHYQIMFTKEEYRKLFTFAFVRNPWDRLVSAYFFLKNGGRNSNDALWAEKNLAAYADFNAFVRDFQNKPEIIHGTHFVPQHNFICGVQGNIEVDFIGRFERINKDFGFICDRLGVKAELAYANKTHGRGDYRRYYIDETADIAEKIYRKDIDLFGYKFEN